MTDPTADWQEWPTDVDCREREWARHMMQCYRERLRDTAEALREVMAWAAPMSEAPRSSRPEWFDKALFILAQLEQEGPA